MDGGLDSGDAPAYRTDFGETQTQTPLTREIVHILCHTNTTNFHTGTPREFEEDNPYGEYNGLMDDPEEEQNVLKQAMNSNAFKFVSSILIFSINSRL